MRERLRVFQSPCIGVFLLLLFFLGGGGGWGVGRCEVVKLLNFQLKFVWHRW